MFSACRRFDIVHDVDMDITEYDACFRSSGLPDDITKDYTRFSRRHFDGGLDTVETHGTKSVGRRSLDQFQISKSSKLEA